MLKRQLITSIVLIAVVGFSGLAWSDVTGTWDCVGTMTVKIGRVSEPIVFADQFILSGGSTFTTTELGAGVWTQINNKKFVMEFDDAEIETYIEDLLLAEFQLDVTVTMTSLEFQGKESKKGIKGKFTMHLEVFDGVETVKVKATTHYEGTSAPVGGPVSAESIASGNQAVLRAIAEKIAGAVSAN